MKNKKVPEQGTLFDTNALLMTNTHVQPGHILASIVQYGDTFRVTWWEITGIQDEWTAIANGGVPINFLHEKWRKLVNVSAYYGNELASLLMQQWEAGGEDNTKAVKHYLLNIKNNVQHGR